MSWLNELMLDFRQHQLRHLHFRELRDDKKRIASSFIAALPVRAFVVASNKRNMVGYKNLSAEKAKINVTAWFYVWLTRILIERVSDYCARRTHADYGEARSIRFEFASRGGVKIGDVARYLAYLKDQEQFGLLYHSYWKPNWSVIDFAEIHTYPARDRVGLQFADCIASAFYTGLENTSAGIVSPEYAKALVPRMARSRNQRIFNFGFKMWPDHAHDLVQPNQRELLEFYRVL